MEFLFICTSREKQEFTQQRDVPTKFRRKCGVCFTRRTFTSATVYLWKLLSNICLSLADWTSSLLDRSRRPDHWAKIGQLLVGFSLASRRIYLFPRCECSPTIASPVKLILLISNCDDFTASSAETCFRSIRLDVLRWIISVQNRLIRAIEQTFKYNTN